MVLFTGSTVEEAIQKGLNEIKYSENESSYQSCFEREKRIFWTFWYKTSSS